MEMTSRLTEEQERALAMLADAKRVSKHEAVVRAIAEVAAARAWSERIQLLSQKGHARYASLLDRLAQ
jgi:predicted transcriptional regulator